MEAGSLVLLLLGFSSVVAPGSGQGADGGVSERLTGRLRRNPADSLEIRLKNTVDELNRQRAELDSLRREKDDILIRLIASEVEIVKLKENAKARVAFSASLANTGEVFLGPQNARTIVFKRIFSNVGEAYDQNTGVFTAPLNGFYYFSFSAFGYNTHVTGGLLVKNGVRQVSTFDDRSGDGSDAGGNAAILQLATGDKVQVELWENGRVFDNLNGHTTFSGFLLFPL